MQICRLKIKNFRGIQDATLFFPKHGVLLGDNNTGKTTVLEALDLVLGPDRLSRTPCVDEHDFYQGKYLKPKPPANPTVPLAQIPFAAPAPTPPAQVPPPPSAVFVPPPPVPVPPTPSTAITIPAGPSAPQIEIEATISHLTDDQKARFADYIDFWDTIKNELYAEAQPAGVDTEPALGL